jgi:hypothetical protein
MMIYGKKLTPVMILKEIKGINQLFIIKKIGWEF